MAYIVNFVVNSTIPSLFLFLPLRNPPPVEEMGHVGWAGISGFGPEARRWLSPLC